MVFVVVVFSSLENYFGCRTTNVRVHLSFKFTSFDKFTRLNFEPDKAPYQIKQCAFLTQTTLGIFEVNTNVCE